MLLTAVDRVDVPKRGRMDGRPKSLPLRGRVQVEGHQGQRSAFPGPREAHGESALRTHLSIPSPR